VFIALCVEWTPSYLPPTAAARAFLLSLARSLAPSLPLSLAPSLPLSLSRSLRTATGWGVSRGQRCGRCGRAVSAQRRGLLDPRLALAHPRRLDAPLRDRVLEEQQLHRDEVQLVAVLVGALALEKAVADALILHLFELRRVEKVEHLLRRPHALEHRPIRPQLRTRTSDHGRCPNGSPSDVGMACQEVWPSGVA